MNETYDDFLYRLREQRKQLGLSQEQMAQRVHKTQSNYSKVELGLQRLSYEELKYLSESGIDIYYIFTGFRGSGKYTDFLEEKTYSEICSYLGTIYSVLSLNDNNREKISKASDEMMYIPLIIPKKKSINAFLTLRRLSGYQQKVMADKIGVDVKKLRELEKDRCLPDSEILWKTYHEFGISPMYILKDKEGTIREVDALLEISEGECTEKLLTIVSSLAEGNKE